MLDNADYLLLDYVVEIPASYESFFSDDVSVLFNRPDHGMGSKELSARLDFLVYCGLIVYSHTVEGGRFIYLSANGGRVWEEKFSPRWEQYFLIESDSALDEGGWEIKSISSCALDSLARVVHKWGGKVDAKKELNEPWGATYWKIFSRGYSLTVSVSERAEGDAFLASLRRPWRLGWVSSIEDELVEMV